MSYANPAQQKSYLAKYRKTRAKSSRAFRQTESNRKKAWYAAHRQREKSKRTARNIQDRNLLPSAIPLVLIDQRYSNRSTTAYRSWEELTPLQVQQCFHRDAQGLLHLRSEKQQIHWLETHSHFSGKPYSIIRGKIWFNKDAVMTLEELKELASRLIKK